MSISENIKSVKARIQSAAKRSGRPPESIRLIAVTKTHPSSTLREALANGIRDIGENRIQDAEKKFNEIREPATWHFIGRLQSNKVKYAARFCDVLHSVDNLKLAAEIEKRFEKPVKAFVEINIGDETAKAGIMPDELFSFLKDVRQYKSVNIVGLMIIPPWSDNPEDTRPYFKKTAELQNEVNRMNILDKPLVEISMGMSGDYETAIEEGATMVRVGTAIFGPRLPRI